MLNSRSTVQHDEKGIPHGRYWMFSDWGGVQHDEKGIPHGRYWMFSDWGGAMGHSPIQQKNGPLTNEIAILNIATVTPVTRDLFPMRDYFSSNMALHFYTFVPPMSDKTTSVVPWDVSLITGFTIFIYRESGPLKFPSYV